MPQPHASGTQPCCPRLGTASPQGLPRSGSAGATAAYAAVLLAFALLKAWPAPACNNPIFAGEGRVRGG